MSKTRLKDVSLSKTGAKEARGLCEVHADVRRETRTLAYSKQCFNAACKEAAPHIWE